MGLHRLGHPNPRLKPGATPNGVPTERIPAVKSTAQKLPALPTSRDLPNMVAHQPGTAPLPAHASRRRHEFALRLRKYGSNSQGPSYHSQPDHTMVFTTQQGQVRQPPVVGPAWIPVPAQPDATQSEILLCKMSTPVAQLADIQFATQNTTSTNVNFCKLNVNQNIGYVNPMSTTGRPMYTGCQPTKRASLPGSPTDLHSY